MENALRGLVLGLLLALGACGGGGDSGPTVIASARTSGSDSVTLADPLPHIYEVLSAPATTSGALDITATLTLELTPGFNAWVQFAEDGIAMDGFSQPITSGPTSATLHHPAARPGDHVYSVRVMVQGVTATSGSLKVSDAALTITG
jgi:hypothetical protein